MSESPERSPAQEGWDQILSNLKSRYPGQKDSVLFCLHKLQQNRDLTLPDIRDEARLHGIPLAGRSLHSAKVLLGMARPATRKPAKDAGVEPKETKVRTEPARSRPRTTAADDGSIEDKVLDAVRQIQSAASQQNERLRLAVKQAIALLQRALDD